MPNHRALIELVGTMKVHLLAELAGMTVGQLAALILPAGEVGVPDRHLEERDRTHSKRSRKPRGAVVSASAPARARTRGPRSSKSTREAAKARAKIQLSLFDDGPTPTLVEIHEALDRWLLGEALEQTNGNITRVAARLGITRKRVRNRWAEVRDLESLEVQRRFAKLQSAEPPPALDDLRALGALAAVHDAVDHWALSAVLTQEDGNLSAAARRLSISRRTLRENRARLRIG